MKKAKQTCILLMIVLILFFYYHLRNTSHIKLPRDSILSRNKLRRMRVDNNGRYFIKTPECAIPDYSDDLTFQNISTKNSCGERAVFVNKLSGGKLQLKIDNAKMVKYISKKEKYMCCYQSANRSRIGRGEDNYISYSPCVTFKSGTSVKFTNEVLIVTCTVYYKNKTEAIFYDDAYIILRRVKLDNNAKRKSWNVLLIGIDGMSRTRFFKTMPRTSNFIRQNRWLDYKVYHANSFESFPNLMAILTGENKSSINAKCKFGMDFCVNDTLWTHFKETGYATAYGEDFIHSESATFSQYYGFTTSPTHHYMRPLYLTGEAREDNIMCTKKLPSVAHLLDYSFQFANVYKREKYFGVFWHNIYKNIGVVPKLIDDTFTDFLMKLNKQTDILDSTFILFMSNHGITYGDSKIPVASYYEERLPMLFIWVPNRFRKLFRDKYINLQDNQNAVTSAYDVYSTISNILDISINSTNIMRSNACSHCISFFEKIPNSRSCTSAGIDEKFCTCHELKEFDDEGAEEALGAAVSYIKELSVKIDTIPFSNCARFELDRILRINSYTSGGMEYYILAFTMIPGNITFEAIVIKEYRRYRILEPVDSISGYNKLGSCVIDDSDRPYCVCEMSNPCENIF